MHGCCAPHSLELKAARVPVLHATEPKPSTPTHAVDASNFRWEGLLYYFFSYNDPEAYPQMLRELGGGNACTPCGKGTSCGCQ